jgi:mono/diheme cytochrome c family protein
MVGGALGAAPFYDRRVPRRTARLLLFCLRAGALAGVVIGLTAACGNRSSKARSTRAQDGGGDVPQWVQKERLPRAALPGAELFASSGCTACHTYAGSGHTNLGAPDLTAYGRLHRGTAFDIRFLRCPTCLESGSPMPAFDELGSKHLRQLAVFLEASRGIR